jgi:homoserine dehydrogenase
VFIKQLNRLSKKVPNVYNTVVISTSRRAVISNDFTPLVLDTWESDLANSQTSAPSVDALIELLKKGDRPAILVDNTSNEALAANYPKFLSNKISIATPNKKGFSSDLELWQQIFGASNKSGALVYHEATVGAGLPVISTLKDLVDTGDKVEKIEGIVSGTLSYIFNQFSTLKGSNVKFSEVVKVAKDLGYTEPDPRDDLNGMDVARKVTILARLSGYEVKSPTSFPVQSLIPKPLETAASAEEFLQRLPDYDSELDKLRAEAEAENKVLRFVGKVDLSDSGSVSVGIEKYDASHPFASLNGSDNVISFKTERYQNPLVIQGAGAGAEVTAAGVLGDLIKIVQRLN